MTITTAHEHITVSYNKTFLSHSTLAMRTHGRILCQASEPEISVSLEQLVCFYFLDTVNYVTYYAFLFGGPPLADVY